MKTSFPKIAKSGQHCRTSFPKSVQSGLPLVDLRGFAAGKKDQMSLSNEFGNKRGCLKGREIFCQTFIYCGCTLNSAIRHNAGGKGNQSEVIIGRRLPRPLYVSYRIFWLLLSHSITFIVDITVGCSMPLRLTSFVWCSRSLLTFYQFQL